MNATRAATVRGRALGGVVSLGRVQTPTLALIVERDREIDAFVPETYFQVEAQLPSLATAATAAAGSPARTSASERSVCSVAAAATGQPPASSRSSAPSARLVRRCCTT